MVTNPNGEGKMATAPRKTKKKPAKTKAPPKKKRSTGAKLSNAEKVARLVARRAEIGEIPPVADEERRESCRYDLPLFLKTYMPSVFYRDFDDDALKLLADIQEAMLHGGRKAVARPRGAGKTAISLGACLWAALYAHRRFLVLVAATAPAAATMIADAMAFLISEELCADFPEVCFPIQAIDGKTQRCRYQTYNGESTRLEITREKIVLPTITGEDGEQNASAGVTICAASITGAIRGIHRTDSNNRWIRPDFVLLDDPQTRESAMSQSQTDERERIVAGDCMGLAGHNKKIAAIMACTVINKDDLSERFLNIRKHPEWRGQRTKLVESWGGSDELWREYDETYKSELVGAVERGTASRWYEAHRAEIEHGSRVMCESLIADGEVSALQHARNYLVENGEYAFAAECQNEPLNLTPQAEYSITERQVAEHLSHRARGEVSADAVVVAAALDINRYAISYAVIAATGAAQYEVIDYDFWLPKGRREVWRDGVESPQEAIAAAVSGCVHDLLKVKPYGAQLQTIAVDAGYEASTIYATCNALAREYRGKRIIAARGLSGDKYNEPNATKAIRRGINADYRRGNGGSIMLWDSHHWHIVAQRGFLVPTIASGAVALFGDNATAHTVYAAQMCADKLERTYLTPYRKQVAVWKTTGKNEMGDCTAMSLACISCEGIAPEKRAATVAPAASNAPAAATPKPTTPPAKQAAPLRRPQFPRRGNWVNRW